MLRIKIFIIAVVLFFTFPALANKSADEQEEARRIVNQALEKLGGAENLKSLSSIMVKAKGVEHRSAEVQGYSPNKQTKAEHEEIIVSFLDGKHSLFEHKTGRHDGTIRWRRFIYQNNERVVADFITKSAFVSPRQTAQIERLRLARNIPHLILLEALANVSSLQSLGVRTYLGKSHNIVSFKPQDSNSMLLLYLDAGTNLLSKFEYSMDFPVLGDTLVEYTYSSYRQHPKLGWFPASREIKIGGEPYRSVNYTEVSVDVKEASAMFELPDELKGYVTQPGTVIEIAKGVYIAHGLGGFYPLFVEFKDFVLAIEAPARHPFVESVPADNQAGSSSVTDELIKKIKETVKNKPIKYLAVTHFHTDHAGGARSFIAEGATILTTENNKQFFEKLVDAKFTLVPDRLSANPQPLKIEIFKDKRVITDGERTVELINVGANPHTEESIIVYLPKENYIYQGDLFYFNDESSFPSRDRGTVMTFFAQWLKKNNMTPTRIYGFHDISFATMEHVKKIKE